AYYNGHFMNARLRPLVQILICFSVAYGPRSSVNALNRLNSAFFASNLTYAKCGLCIPRNAISRVSELAGESDRCMIMHGQSSLPIPNVEFSFSLARGCDSSASVRST